MKVCPECKRTAANDSNFCSFCGSKVAPLVAEKPQYTTLHSSPSVVLPSKRKNKTKNILALVLGLCFPFFVVCVICAVVAIYSSNKPSSSIVTSRPESSSSSSLSSSSSSYNISDIDALIKIKAEANGLNIVETEYVYSTKTYIVSVMPEDGFAKAAALVPTNPGLAKNWQYMKENTADCCLTFKNLFKNNGFEKVGVRIDILNDENPNNRLLTFYNGKCTYDCTEE